MDQTSHTTQNHLKNTCKMCKGLGYIIEHKIVSEYDQNTPVEFATPCPACRGNQSDHRTGIPQMFSEADMGKFDFTRYGGGTGNIEHVEQLPGSVRLHIRFGEELKVIDQKWLLRSKYK